MHLVPLAIEFKRAMKQAYRHAIKERDEIRLKHETVVVEDVIGAEIFVPRATLLLYAF